MRRLFIIFTVIILCFIVLCLLFGARETVYFFAKIYVGYSVILMIALVVGFLFRGKHNDIK